MEALDSTENPFIITQPEFMRRYKEMSQTGGGGMMMMGDLPDTYNLIINSNHPLMDKILKAKKNKEKYVNQALDLAKLSQNLLTGKEMTEFIKRSFDLMK
jgi:molecular chaperone HtpG